MRQTRSALILLVPFLALLVAPYSAHGQGCAVTLQPHFSIYTNVSSTTTSITTTVTTQGYASVSPSASCQMQNATHKAAVTNKLNGTGSTTYGTPGCATCYITATSTKEIIADPGIVYPFVWDGSAICSLAGEFWGGGGNGPQYAIDSTPVIMGISPSEWVAGTTKSVTFTGQYFGTNTPTLAFSPSAGISYTLTSHTDTQIVASITVASSTPNEDVGITVTNTGYGGLAFNGASAGQSAKSSAVNATVVHAPVSAPEVTVIAWINGSAPDLVTLPAGNQTLVTQLNNTSASCAGEVGAWILGSPVNINGPTDQDYANSWLIKYSANPAPPTTIVPANQRSAGNFRAMNDFGGTPNGFHQLGKTPDPCGVKFAVLRAIIAWTSSGESSPYDGITGTSPSGKVYQIIEGRLGKPGQAANLTINSRTTPYIFSVIKFDSAGNPTYNEHSMFPTFSVYVNGTLVNTFPQSKISCFASTPSQCFAGQDQTYQMTPSQVQ